jgi:hypothetical protein
MPVYSSPQLQVPDSVEALTFRAIESVLRNDSVLGPLLRHFAALRDESADFQPPEWGLCPYLRLEVTPISSDWVTEGQHLGGFTLNFIMAVQGTNISNLYNFWGVIRRAIFPLDVDQAALIRQKIRGPHPDVEGPTRMVIRQMVDYQPSGLEDVTRRFYVGRGIMDVPMLIRT